MIWIIAGTSEGRKIVDRIKDLDNFIATVATEGGKEFIETDKLKVGRMTYVEMANFVDENSISMIVDMTHPFAKIVSDNARNLAREKDITYIRYVRSRLDSLMDSIYLRSYEDAYKFMEGLTNKTVFFTTGSKNIGDFEKVKGNNRFIYRILPALDSIQEAIKYEVSMKDTIGILGPFSLEHNKLHLKEYEADYCIMKDSGKTGGTLDKIKACEELGVKAIVIGRDEEEGFKSLDEIEEIIRKEGEKHGKFL